MTPEQMMAAYKKAVDGYFDGNIPKDLQHDLDQIELDFYFLDEDSALTTFKACLVCLVGFICIFLMT